MYNENNDIREIINLYSDTLALNNGNDLNKISNNIFKSIITMLGIL